MYNFLKIKRLKIKNIIVFSSIIIFTNTLYVVFFFLKIHPDLLKFYIHIPNFIYFLRKIEVEGVNL